MFAVGVVVQLPAHALWVGLIPVLAGTAQAVLRSLLRVQAPGLEARRARPTPAPPGLLRQGLRSRASVAPAGRLSDFRAIFGPMSPWSCPGKAPVRSGWYCFGCWRGCGVWCWQACRHPRQHRLTGHSSRPRFVLAAGTFAAGALSSSRLTHCGPA